MNEGVDCGGVVVVVLNEDFLNGLFDGVLNGFWFCVLKGLFGGILKGLLVGDVMVKEVEYWCWL